MTWGPRPLSTFLSELCAARDEGRQRGLDYGFPASMEAPSNAPPFGVGLSPRSLENLGTHYYMGNTKLP
jgi:hypothetical protein